MGYPRYIKLLTISTSGILYTLHITMYRPSSVIIIIIKIISNKYMKGHMNTETIFYYHKFVWIQ